MEKKKIFQNVTIIVLAVAIIIMSVGYAIYYQPLQINGTAVIKNAKWDIHFAGPAATATSNVPASKVSGPTLTNGTSLSFEVNLSVGEVYEFTVDTVNAGTFNAELNTVALVGTKNGSQIITNKNGYANDYFNYKVTYDDGSEIKVGDTLDKGETKTLKVVVRYDQPTNDQDLPTNSETYKFTLDLNYSQTA